MLEIKKLSLVLAKKHMIVKTVIILFRGFKGFSIIPAILECADIENNIRYKKGERRYNRFIQ
jgi:hypothetical protein